MNAASAPAAPRALIAALAAAVLGLAPASAQAGDNPSAGEDVSDVDISGAWSFRTTSFYNYGCEMDGDVMLTPTDDPDLFSCEMVAKEDCPGRGYYTARQVCAARRDGSSVRIMSELVSVSPDTESYLPDNFSLEIVSDTQMLGDLDSFGIIAPAVFFRGAGSIS